MVCLFRSTLILILPAVWLANSAWAQPGDTSFGPARAALREPEQRLPLLLPPPPIHTEGMIGQTTFLQPVPEPPEPAGETLGSTADEFVADRFARSLENNSDRERFDVGVDLYSSPDFAGGLVISGENVAMKIGGFVKADFIYDFNPIDSTDTFDTTTIPVDAPPRTNSRFHARQTRLSFDTHWMASERTVRIFVEGDFFSDNDRYRLRHAYGEVGPLLVGQTWTTFTDVAAAPSTLDFEGSVSSVNRRQAQARWTEAIMHEDVTLSLAVEDSREIIQLPVNLKGDPRTPSPDFVRESDLKGNGANSKSLASTVFSAFNPMAAI